MGRGAATLFMDPVWDAAATPASPEGRAQRPVAAPTGAARGREDLPPPPQKDRQRQNDRPQNTLSSTHYYEITH